MILAVEEEEGEIFEGVGAGDAGKGCFVHRPTIMASRDIGGLWLDYLSF